MTVIEHTKYSNSTQVNLRGAVLSAELNWNLLFVCYSKPHWDAMLRFCVSLVKEKTQAEDLLQSTLLKGLKAFPKFVSHYKKDTQCNEEIHLLFVNSEIQHHFKNWLYKIIKNLYLDDKENRKKWEQNLSDESLKDVEDKNNVRFFHADSFLSGDKVQNLDVIQKEEREFYRLALDDQWEKRFEALNARQKTVLFLAAEDYSYKEISSILDVPIGTVMSTLSRSLQKLKVQAE